MKRGLALTLILLTAALAGCIGQEGPNEDLGEASTPTDQDTQELLPETISGLEESTVLELEGSGTGIWIDEARDLLYSANGGGGFAVVDISDPDQPERLGLLDEIYARDVDMLQQGNTTLALLAGGGEGLHVVDVTDPREPELLATADDYSVHNVAAVPGTPYVYDATAVGADGKIMDPVIPVLDVTNPSDPTWETIPIPATVNGQPIQSDGCHDIVVRMDLGMAFCAGGGSMYAQGGGESFIWDISQSPLEPEWVGVIDNPSIVYHHQAIANEAGDLLFINDEFIAPNCQGVEAGDTTLGQTTAAMWIYDISDPTSPELVSWVQQPRNEPPPTDGSVPNCGSHFGDLIDGRDVVVWGWYQGGTMLIDVSDPANPTILDQQDPTGSTWDARYHAGHVYGSSSDLQIFDIV